MFIPRPTLKTRTLSIDSTTMAPMTSVILNSSPPSEAIRTSTTSAGSRPARSNRNAKQKIPTVTIVIGFHFGASVRSADDENSANTATMPPSDIMM
jgi:hypothetical protein